MYDLHLHSIYSDGIVSVKEILDSILDLQLKGFSLTDHDTFNGIKEANTLAKSHNLDFIPGIEFGITMAGREVHILGYYIDINNKNIIDIVERSKRNRIERTKKILNKLSQAGINISNEEIKEYSKKDIISRSHLAQILVDKGYSSSIVNSFEKYLGSEGLAYVEKISISYKEILQAIKSSGGVSILAHPGDIGDDNIVYELIHGGIDGLEIINSKHTLEQIEKYYNISNKYHLIETCGSDCHGKIINGSKYIGKFILNKKNIKRIKALHKIRTEGM
ncbi:PHP domain-containing protein [Miniphocaeibacter halophilus]|uniref:PHP domain-containing protein n=1 Tax=Miniphocaeibacter halophilus TaxID=2931922 RepID=A0AC61MPZ7_9FIRM|nr:PHP domain-containing protein [Miniphocaeibacter halophilus]QQK07614.1 PHP domain-containing protein [Miniphocaeibacter halophilus]